MSSSMAAVTLRRIQAVRPSIASSSRSLATVSTVLEPVIADHVAEVVPTTTDAAPAAPSHRRQALPKTGAPTPYHPYVHLPLLSFFAPAAQPTSPPTSPLVVPLPSPLFNTPSRPSLLHKLVISHLASLRRGTASTKNRSEVNYSGKKIRPQKGTGKARLGTRGSPMLMGGGRAFGPRPKGDDGWNRKVNRKEERLGLRVSLSEKWRSGELAVVDRIAMESISTRVLNSKLGSRGWLDALFITASGSDDGGRKAFELSSGNLSDVALVSKIDKLGVWDIVKRKKVVIELAAIDEVIARLDPENEWGVDDEDFEDDSDLLALSPEEYEELAQEMADMEETEMGAGLEEALKNVEIRSA